MATRRRTLVHRIGLSVSLISTIMTVVLLPFDNEISMLLQQRVPWVAIFCGAPIFLDGVRAFVQRRITWHVLAALLILGSAIIGYPLLGSLIVVGYWAQLVLAQRRAAAAENRQAGVCNINQVEQAR